MYVIMMSINMKQQAIKEFADLVRKRYGDKIEKIVLYGSTARAENNADSDIDILVLSDKQYNFLQRELSFLAFDIGSKYGFEISVQNYDLSHYQKFSNYSFFQNVDRDGVLIG